MKDIEITIYLVQGEDESDEVGMFTSPVVPREGEMLTWVGDDGAEEQYTVVGVEYLVQQGALTAAAVYVEP